MVTPARGIDGRQTELTRQRYDRIAPVYDALEWMMEWRARRWRRDLWGRVGGGQVLELGVGTGKNIGYYPRDREVVALDLSEGMLARARRKAARRGIAVRFELGDVQALPFQNATFEVVVATFLFCSVPDPVRGLVEARRVLKPGGRLLLIEHVLSHRPLLRRLMRWLDPIALHVWGAHIDRDTIENVRRAAFAGVSVTNLSLDIVQRIEATAPS